jgi:HEAT repeat protein
MAKPSPVLEKKLARIAEIKRAHPGSAEDELRALIGEADVYLVGVAVDAAAELRLEKLALDLLQRFDRLLGEDAEQDRSSGRSASQKIIEALTAFETPAKDAYLRGLRTFDPIGARDRAAGLRIACARALSQVHYRDAVVHLVEAMVDPVPDVRVGVLRALGSIASESATVLLTFQLLSGDRNIDIVGTCMEGLLRRDIERTLPLVSRYLHNENDTLAEAAALALGESREPAALEPLVRAFDPQGAPRVRQTVLVAIAFLRQAAGNQFLLQLLEREKEAVAVQALTALAIVRHMTGVEERVRAIVETRSTARLHLALREAFD